MPAHGPEVAALVRHRSPAALAEEPALRLGADRLGEAASRRRPRAGRAGRPASLTRPRSRARPGAGRRPHAARPPGRPRRRRRRRSRGCGGASARRRSRGPRARRPRRGRPRPRSGRAAPRRARAAPSIASSTCIPWSTTLTTAWRIAPRRRAEPALPTTSLGRPRRRTIEGAIMLVSRVPGRASPPAGFRSYSPSMLFMWMPVPGTITPGAGAGRGGQRRRVPHRVDDRDVRRSPLALLGHAGQRPHGRAARPPACSARRTGAARARRGRARARSCRSRARPCSRITSASRAIAAACPAPPAGRARRAGASP